MKCACMAETCVPCLFSQTKVSFWSGLCLWFTIWAMSCEASFWPLTGSRVRPRSNVTNFCTLEKYCWQSWLFSTRTNSWKLSLTLKRGCAQFVTGYGTEGKKQIVVKTYVSVANHLPLVAVASDDVTLRQVEDVVFVGQVEIYRPQVTLK